MSKSRHSCHSDDYYSHQVLESDLHLLLKYYISVVPRAEQVGVAIKSVGDEDDNDAFFMCL